MKFLLVCMVLLINVFGYDISKIGVINKDEFPFKIEDNKSFDLASRFEILSYVKQISKINRNENNLREFFQEEFNDIESINKWIIFTKELLVINYMWYWGMILV